MTDTGTTRASGTQGQLAEIWGDVVSRPQLGKAMAIGAVVSVAVYFVALAIIAPLAATPAIGKALAMLAGIVGSVAGGTICARIFLPKRIVVEQMSDGATWQADILEQLEQDGGPIGRMQDLSPVVVEEMRQVGLHDVFLSYERDRQTGSKGE